MAVPKGNDGAVILYVEDDALTRQSIRQQLTRRGFAVLHAASGEEALAAVKEGPAPRIALLDVELPGIDGVETYRRLREAYPDLAAVVCSANLTAGVRRVLLEMGVPEHCLLTKPCTFRAILDALQCAGGNGSDR